MLRAAFQATLIDSNLVLEGETQKSKKLLKCVLKLNCDKTRQTGILFKTETPLKIPDKPP